MHDPFQYKIQILRLTGVIESSRSVWLTAARPPDKQIRAPATPTHLAKKSLRIVRAYSALEAMEEKNVRCIASAVVGSVEPVNLEEIVVWCFPAFDSSWYGLLSPDHLSPERLRVTAGDPPGGAITSGNVVHAC